MSTLQKLFISSTKFAVLGASVDRTKFGNKILRFYQSHELPVIPIHPKESEIEGLKTIDSLDKLESPSTTSLSIVTPPVVTLAALKKSKELSIPYIWIQPGASDDAVAEYIKENLSERVIYGGPCLLVLGDALIASTTSHL